MKMKGMIAAIAIVLALAAPVSMIAADALSDGPDLAAEGGAFEDLGGVFSGDGDINIDVTSELVFALCILAAIGMIAVAYYYRS